MKRAVAAITTSVVVLLGTAPMAARADDQPQWGERYTRNMISAEKGLPDAFQAGERNRQTGEIDLPADSGVKWVAKLGSEAHGTPVIAGGKVFVGTNNGEPRDPRVQGDRGVLMCFDEATGEFLWQLVVPKLEDDRVKWGDWRQIGLISPPVVEGNRAYLVTNRCEIACIDAEGMANGNDGPYTDEARHMALRDQPPLEPGPKDGDIVWLFDIIDQTKAEPHNGSNCSILVHGDLLYVCSSNGVEWTHMYVKHPEAPSLIVLDKHTGKLVAQDQFGIGPDITHGQWSSPAMTRIGDRDLGFFGAGNGVLYAFEMLDPEKGTGPFCAEHPSGLSGKMDLSPFPPVLLANVWKFHGHPIAQTQDEVPVDHQHDSTSYELTAMPVVYNNRLYVPFTQEPFHNMKLAWLTCLDPTKTGDVTRSALVWSYDKIAATCSTVAAHDGLVYAADFYGDLHCLDAETGQPYWVHRAGGPIWGSPLVADGKVYLGTGTRKLWVLKAGKQLEVISEIPMRDPVLSSPVAANGVLYVMTNKHLYAVSR